MAPATSKHIVYTAIKAAQTRHAFGICMDLVRGVYRTSRWRSKFVGFKGIDFINVAL
jgi:hypothetical protein